MARKIQVEIIGDSRSVEKAFRRSGQSADKFNAKIHKSGIGMAKALAGIGVAAGGLAIVLGVKSVKAASNLGEQINKTNIVFGKGAKMIQRFARTTASSFGISNEKALEFAGVFGNMLVPMGIARGRAAVLSKNLVKLAADMASFNNASPEEVLIALQSGLAGQIEPLRRYGVFLTQDRILAEALSTGLVKMNVDSAKVKLATIAVSEAQREYSETLKKHGVKSLEAQTDLAKLEYAQSKLTKAIGGTRPTLTNEQKALATLSIIMKDTTDAHGDFSRTLGSSLPNAIRVLRAQVTDLMAAFGKGLLPVVQRAAQALRRQLADPRVRAFVQRLGYQVGTVLLNAFIGLGRWFDAHWTQIVGGFRTFAAVVRGAIPLARTLKSVVVTITKPLQIQLKILLAIWDKVLSAIATGADLLSRLPTVTVFGHKVGGDSFAGVRDAANAAKGVLNNPTGSKPKKKKESTTPLYDGPRAMGGPVRGGLSYRVGERGPEMFVPSQSGYIVPNGGGGISVGVVHVHGVQDVRKFTSELQRLAKRGASQQRGRLGGQNLALS